MYVLTGWPSYIVKACVHNATNTCRSRFVRLIKSIRLSGNTALELMTKHRDIKLIFLIRDPRATIFSQSNIFNILKSNPISSFSHMYCRTLWNDLTYIRKITHLFPERIKILRYEKLADNPLSVSPQLYHYLGLNYTRSVYTAIYNMTTAGQKAITAYSTTRGNSSSAAVAWRKKIHLSMAKIIDRNCVDVYPLLGYRSVENLKDLTNLSFSLIQTADFHGMWL